MTKPLRRHAAILTAALILTAGTGAAFPESIGGLAETESVLEFVNKLHHQQTGERYASLRLSPAQSEIYRDGSAVGDSFGGFCIRGGQPLVSRSLTLRSGEQNNGSAYIPLSEAAEKIGCEIREMNGEFFVESPFQKAELIVQSDGGFDRSGAVSVTEGYRDLHLLKYETPADAYAAYQKLKADPAVREVEPNRTVHIAEDTAPTDPRFIDVSDRWGLDAIGADEYRTWLLSEKPSLPDVVVAVIDTGLYEDHVWFRGRIAEGGTGFCISQRGNTDDKHGHGTHCAGIICSATTNNVKIMPLKALDDDGYGESIEIYCAMAYAAEQNADVVSMSLGGLGISPLMRRGAEELAEKDIPCVVSAGNESMDARYAHPASEASAITVSALQHDTYTDDAQPYTLASYSNFGADVDFSAPGSDILSASNEGVNETCYKSGTSMAAPYVAACAADLLSYDKDMTTEMLCSSLSQNAVDLGDPGFDAQYGWGMVNLRNLIPGKHSIPAPAASLASGTYDGIQYVSLSCDVSYTAIYYTLDGSDPTPETGLLYDGTDVEITESCQLRAIAVNEDERSRVMVCDYKITCAVPEFSVAAGSYSDPVTVSVIVQTPGAVIYYTMDGSIPSKTNGLLYSAPIEIPASAVLQAVAVCGNTVSETVRADYLIGDKDVPNPYVIEDGVLKQYRGVGADLDLSALPITEIGARAFMGAVRLNSVILPDSVTKIGESAFENCTGLTAVTAAGITSLGTAAFRSCSALREVSFDTLAEIPDYAFYDCSSLCLQDGFPGVVSIGDYAFFGCYSLDFSSFDWRNLKSIGDHAFEEALVYSDIHLDALRSLGQYAFSRFYFSNSIYLPKQITALPEGVFADCYSIKYISMPGVTEIGAYALASEETMMASQFETDLQYGQITKVGAYAFRNYRFDKSPVFSSLTEIDENAFRDAEADSMSFPALKILRAGMLDGVKTPVLYLETVEQIGGSLLLFSGEGSAYSYLVVGDDLTEIDAFAEITDSMRYAGPADSPLADFAASRNAVYYETPFVVLDLPKNSANALHEFDLAAEQYYPFEVRAFALGFDCEIKWFRVSDADGTDPVPAVTTADGRLRADTTAVGESWYYAAAVRGGDILCRTDILHITVNETPVAGTLTEQDPCTLIDWTDVPQDDYGCRTLAYTLNVQESGSYMIFPGNTVMNLTVYDAQGNGYDSYVSIDMKKGETYTLILQFMGDDPVDFLNSVCIRPAGVDYRGFYGVDMQIPDDIYDYTGSPIRPEVTVTDTVYTEYDSQQVVLKEGRDYELIYRDNDDCGTGKVYIVGIGDYSGIYYRTYRIIRDLKEDQVLAASQLNEIEKAYYRFVPSESGYYRVFAMPSEQLLDSVKDMRYYSLAFDCSVDTYDSSWNYVNYEDNSVTNDFFHVYLKAGEVYYFEVYGSGDVKNARVSVSRRKHVSELDVSVSESDDAFSYTGAPLTPEVTVSDGAVKLTEGKDYTLSYAANVLPGTMAVLISGIGNYCGFRSYDRNSIILEMRESENFEYIEPGTPFTFSETVQNFAADIQAEGYYSLNLAEGSTDSSFSCDVYCFEPALTLWVYYASFIPGEDAQWFQEGSYALLMRQKTAQEMAFTLDGFDVHFDIAKADLTVNNVRYTGKAVYPRVIVSYEEKTLREGTDYGIELLDDAVSCGLHAFNVNGIGEYEGALQGSYAILPDPSAVTETAEVGENTVHITALGETAILRFSGSHGTYMLRSDGLEYRCLKLYDNRMQETVNLSGCAGAYEMFTVRRDEDYLLLVSFGDSAHTGDISFTIQEDYRMLSDCELRCQEVLPFEGAAAVPEYSVYDGDKMLEEGVDYECFCIGAENKIGRASVTLGGLGRYDGELTFSYYICPEIGSDAWNDPEQLTLNEETRSVRDYPGTYHDFSFTAPYTGVFYLDVPYYEYCGVNTFICKGSELLPMDTRIISLTKGDVLYFRCVTDWLEGFYNNTDDFIICISDEVPGMYLDKDGVYYYTENGEAHVDDFDYSLVGIYVPDTIYVDHTNISATFAGFYDSMTEELRGAHVIYGNPDGPVAQYCFEHNILFSELYPHSAVKGDVNGDGIVWDDDCKILMYWLGEGKGMFLSDQAYSNADMNGDGNVDLRDVRAMLSYISETAMG